MNDEQFQEDTEALRRGGYVSLVDDLRARDAAQREALARAEAERDTAIVQMQNIRKQRDAINKRLGDAEFTLCIAQQQLAEAVGLLREFAGAQEAKRQGVGNAQRAAGISQLVVAEERVVAFLARHAQAEQQEATKTCSDERPCVNCFADNGDCLGPKPVEAQDAQAVEFQREALERVGAEAGRLAKAGLAAHVRADTAQAQLAEAVGLLREVNSQRFTTLATVEIIESFIDRHSQTFHDRAQAEQQEAQGDPLGLAPYASLFNEAPAEALKPNQKAQGAQAGDFWTWLDFAYRDGSKGEGRNFTKYNMEVAYHAGILHARAALATQPYVRGAEHDQ